MKRRTLDITFKPVDKLTPEEKEFTRSKSGCTVKHAGQPLTTGKQACSIEA